MGCSKFGERWDASPEDLMVESYVEAMEDAGIEPNQLDAAWFSHHIDDIGAGKGGTPMSIALKASKYCRNKSRKLLCFWIRSI